MIDLTSVSLMDVLPDSLKGDPAVMAMAAALDKELTEITKLVTLPTLYCRIDELDSQTLDHLAWQFNADTWRKSWHLPLKRSVIKSIIMNKRQKGTRWAIEDAVSSLGANVTVVEWWETTPPGEPHTFAITSTVNHFAEQVPPGDMLDDINRRIAAIKPARSHYTFNQAISVSGNVVLVGSFNSFIYRRLSGREG
ncbi:phage tail protein I [Yersinia proxima]|uniref:phage tail protein I n=1 Tax=Yersinia proxima TaxID=2890316 RepID=UPI0037D2436E